MIQLKLISIEKNTVYIYIYVCSDITFLRYKVFPKLMLDECTITGTNDGAIILEIPCRNKQHLFRVMSRLDAYIEIVRAL